MTRHLVEGPRLCFSLLPVTEQSLFRKDRVRWELTLHEGVIRRSLEPKVCLQHIPF